MVSKRTLPESFTCKGCNELIQRKPAPAVDLREMFCSPKCKIRSFALEQGLTRVSTCGQCKLTFIGYGKAYCSSECTSAAFFAKHPRISRSVNCEICHCSFIANGKRRTCSKSCWIALRAENGKERKPYRAHKREVRPCPTCGDGVLSSHAKGRRCVVCERRAKGGSYGTRAKRMGVPCDYSIKNVLVFKRDGWRCQLCGCATPRRLRGKNLPASPELDHITPIAAGGGHTWDNVQLTCRKCNQAKGAKPLGQMRLIA